MSFSKKYRNVLSFWLLEAWAHTSSSTPPPYIEVSEPSQENERSCIWDRSFDIADFYDYTIKFWKCSDSVNIYLFVVVVLFLVVVVCCCCFFLFFCFLVVFVFVLFVCLSFDLYTTYYPYYYIKIVHIATKVWK